MVRKLSQCLSDVIKILIQQDSTFHSNHIQLRQAENGKYAACLSSTASCVHSPGTQWILQYRLYLKSYCSERSRRTASFYNKVIVDYKNSCHDSLPVNGVGTSICSSTTFATDVPLLLPRL